MTRPMLDTVLATVRPLAVRGKGFVFDRVTPREGIRSATVAGRYAMTLNLANVVHRQIYMGCFARAMTQWARALLRPGGTFVDVGAHAGYFSLLASDLVGSSGRVFAVEPNPAVFATLCAHLAANGIDNVNACECGVAERGGWDVLHVPDLSVRDFNATLLRRADWHSVRVPLRRLDECLDAWMIDRIDLMKIDVEGAEPRVLAGGAAHLAKGVVRHVMIEINGPRLVEAGSRPAALVTLLAALGFAPARLVGEHVVRVPETDVDLDPTHEQDRLFVHDVADRPTGGAR
jgi:FkbM family methyltransferase